MDNKIVLYGGGKTADYIYSKYKDSIIGVIDNYKSGMFRRNVPYLSLEDFQKRYFNTCVYISSIKYADQMRKELEEAGIKYKLPDELFDKLMEVLRQPLVDGLIPQFPGDVLKKLPEELQELLQQDVTVYIIVRLGMDEGRFVMMDTGRRIALNEDHESKELVTENYDLIKKLSKSVAYQYVLDMNYSVVTFSF